MSEQKQEDKRTVLVECATITSVSSFHKTVHEKPTVDLAIFLKNESGDYYKFTAHMNPDFYPDGKDSIFHMLQMINEAAANEVPVSISKDNNGGYIMPANVDVNNVSEEDDVIYSPIWGLQ